MIMCLGTHYSGIRTIKVGFKARVRVNSNVTHVDKSNVTLISQMLHL